ncbi:hypothetical protein LZC95_50725 [Pendulispora brunnea]|uniref:Lipoprotein n=1 Tax=Pendulispora brunnea TaxID=2905690 RepID=A0ABZ2K7L8_9BACT
MKTFTFASCMSFVLLACLGTPDTPPDRPFFEFGRCGVSDGLPFSQYCRQACVTSRDCAMNEWCMFVEGGDSIQGTPVCVDYKHCAYLGSDTECTPTDIGGVEGCASHASWQIERLAGNPACGRPHEVLRCMTNPGGGCVLTPVTTYDVGHP